MRIHAFFGAPPNFAAQPSRGFHAVDEALHLLGIEAPAERFTTQILRRNFLPADEPVAVGQSNLLQDFFTNFPEVYGGWPRKTVARPARHRPRTGPSRPDRRAGQAWPTVVSRCTSAERCLCRLRDSENESQVCANRA